jgi:uncharacterized membrane protein
VKKIVNFVKTTILGGLVAVVPLAVLFISLGMLLGVLVDFTTAMADVLPYGALANATIILGVAVLLLVAICFGAGLLVRTAFGSAAGDRMHGILSRHLPLYKAIRNITQSAAGMQGREFDLALIDLHGSTSRVLGAVMEELPEDRVAAYVPLSPTLGVGQVYVLPRASVEPLDVPIADFAASITQWGVGTEKLFGVQNLTE